MNFLASSHGAADEGDPPALARGLRERRHEDRQPLAEVRVREAPRPLRERPLLVRRVLRLLPEHLRASESLDLLASISGVQGFWMMCCVKFESAFSAYETSWAGS